MRRRAMLRHIGRSRTRRMCYDPWLESGSRMGDSEWRMTMEPAKVTAGDGAHSARAEIEPAARESLPYPALVGILGGGQLARMTGEAASRLGVEVAILEREA